MGVIDILKQRKSVRSFLPDKVDREKIELILDSAKYAPSGANMQPFDVCVVSGKKKIEIENKMLEAFDSGIEEKMDYQYYPLIWKEPYKTRRINTGQGLYKTIGIARGDKKKRVAQWRENFKAFGAPTVLYFFIDSSLDTGSYMDYGMFLQSIMLAATDLGIATCPIVSLAEFPSIVKRELGIDKDKVLLCGIALGYEDRDAPINSFKTDRLKLKEFTRFFE